MNVESMMLFCPQCEAPMRVRDGGLQLVEESPYGPEGFYLVTSVFCHGVEAWPRVPEGASEAEREADIRAHARLVAGRVYDLEPSP